MKATAAEINMLQAQRNENENEVTQLEVELNNARKKVYEFKKKEKLIADEMKNFNKIKNIN